MENTGMVCITGGIGSGKSVVSRVLRLKGYSVYDCDSSARALLNASEECKSRLESLAGTSLRDVAGNIDRKKMAGIFFTAPGFRSEANSMIHEMVRDDIRKNLRECGQPFLFVETAIPAESSLDSMSDVIWLVDAPERLRIERVMKRSGMTAEEVRMRILTQSSEFDHLDPEKTRKLKNYGSCSVLSQIDKELGLLERKP